MTNKRLNWVVGIAMVVWTGFLAYKLLHRPPTQPPESMLITNILFSTGSPPTNAFKQIIGFKPAKQFTDSEKELFKEIYAERLKPAFDRWCNAYSNRIPFDVSQFTIDTFYSKGAGGYTFMLGSTTLVIFNGRSGAKVFYMMTREGAMDLNGISKDGQPRDLSVPVTREEVLKMATADTGKNYEPKDVVIHPTAKFSNIDGGAEVQVGIKYLNDGMLMSPDNLAFVIGSDGKLVTYQH